MRQSTEIVFPEDTAVLDAIQQSREIKREISVALSHLVVTGSLANPRSGTDRRANRGGGAGHR